MVENIAPFAPGCRGGGPLNKKVAVPTSYVLTPQIILPTRPPPRFSRSSFVLIDRERIWRQLAGSVRGLNNRCRVITYYEIFLGANSEVRRMLGGGGGADYGLACGVGRSDIISH